MRLNTLLKDLIDISRIESGEMRMSFRYFALGDLLRSVVDGMRPVAEARSISLIAAPDAFLPRQVVGDKDRLTQALTNLIDNAIKYNTPEGTVSVAVRDGTDRFWVDVVDTGVGMSAEHLPRIFERFYRVDKERSREAGGTGLGLAIVKHIVEAHGGQVEVRSEPGRGARSHSREEVVFCREFPERSLVEAQNRKELLDWRYHAVSHPLTSSILHRMT